MVGRPLACVLVLGLVACSGGRRPTDGGASRFDSAVAVPDGGGAADGASPTTDGGGARDGGSDAGGTGAPTPICVLGCATDADCTTPSVAFDEDNYRCEFGWCRYTGCVDDAECRTAFVNPEYVCRDPGTGVRSCLEGCAAASDCGTATPAFDADNYRCGSGTCVYEGCNTDAECEGTFGAAYGCFDVEPPTTPLPIPTAARNCVRRCSISTDCATDSGAFDADNYECVSGSCRYRGCNGDVECQTSLSSSSYVCR